MDICHSYVSKHDSNCEKQIIFLMIQMENDGIILNLKKISIIKRNNVETQSTFSFFELPSFFCNKSKLESHKKVC